MLLDAGGAFYLYNKASRNDIFYISGNKNIEHSSGSYKNYSSYYSVPFGYWDYEVFYSTSESRQKIGGSAFGLMYTGKSQYLDLKGSRMLYRDKTQKVSASAELIKRKIHYNLNDIELVVQKRNMTNLRVGSNYKQRFLIPCWLASWLTSGSCHGRALKKHRTCGRVM